MFETRRYEVGCPVCGETHTYERTWFDRLTRYMPPVICPAIATGVARFSALNSRLPDIAIVNAPPLWGPREVKR